MRRHRSRRFIALSIAVGLVAVACGDDDSEGGAGPVDGATNTSAPATTVVPQAGGTLTIATYQETMGLDPLVSTGGGITGGTEMAAIYDTLTRYNTETNKIEMRTAESVTPNADSTEWTIKIRPGIKFTDGTDYDADAVSFGILRHVSGLIPGIPPCEELRACPRSAISSAGYMGGNLKAVQVVDKLTVKVTMSQPFPTFPAAIAGSSGMIPSPTALKAACPADKAKLPRECSFNLKPVGAGPFVVDQFSPKESITMKKNPNYWNGPVYLDGLKFVNFNDSGGDKTYEALKVGTVNVAVLRTWPAVRAAEADKMTLSTTLLAGGVSIILNHGIAVTCANGQPPICAGKPDGPYTAPVPTARLKVRQAFAAAIDPVQVDARIYEGKGKPGTELVDKSASFYPDVPGHTYDVNKAKQLVQEAKAEGWDGKIRWVCSNNPYGQSITQAVQAMLQVAGFNVETKLVDNVSVDVITNRDYDSACWGLSAHTDDLGFWNLFNNFASNSGSNRAGYKSPAMDAGLNIVRAAATDEQKKAGYKAMSEAYIKEIPMISVDALPETIASQPSVQNLAKTVQSMVHYDKAWIKK
jgi:peptide/nickel transport system substrate-binding protein